MNLDVFDRYWKKRFVRRKTTEDSKRSAKDHIRRALAALGDVSLIDGDIDDLQAKLDVLPANKQRRVVSWINSLFKFCNREDRLTRTKEEKTGVSYIPIEDLNHLLQKLAPERRLPVQVAFHTGLRLGELLGVSQ